MLRIALLLAILMTAAPAFAQIPDPDPHRFDDAIQAFSEWDAKNASPADPILFVGSSSIRFWNTAERFPDLPVVNRGFGGSHISDVLAYMDETVLRYHPRMIVFYAGDNDVAAGKGNDQVVGDYLEFIDRVHAADPEVDIVCLPIKPSLARWALWPQMAEANARIAEHARGHERLHYVDLAAPLLGGDGSPLEDVFLEDGLHLNEAGYDLWSAELGPVLRELAGPRSR